MLTMRLFSACLGALNPATLQLEKHRTTSYQRGCALHDKENLQEACCLSGSEAPPLLSLSRVPSGSSWNGATSVSPPLEGATPLPQARPSATPVAPTPSTAFNSLVTTPHLTTGIVSLPDPSHGDHSASSARCRHPLAPRRGTST
jgi:hypothetical protein